jgi:hypothetical protein
MRQRIGRRVSATVAVCGFLMAAVLGGPGVASATDPKDAPAGYGGPFASCSGEWFKRFDVPGTPGYVDIWYSPAGSGTFCAKTFDNLAGNHHMEVILQHALWQTRWYDSGIYATYAGGIYVSDANARCPQVYGEVTVDGQRHTTGWQWVCG